MTPFHQKSQKPGKRYSAPPKKKHTWKAGLSRRVLEIEDREKQEEEYVNRYEDIISTKSI
jgi:hypothetical protein